MVDHQTQKDIGQNTYTKANQADAITAAFQKYSAKVLDKEQDKPCSIVPIAAARCMSTAPTMASGFLNIPVPIIPKFRVGHYALHNTVSMRVLS